MTLVAEPQPPTTPAAAAGGRLRLEYLDGLRGLACLYVLLLHAWMLVPWEQSSGALAWIGRATRWVLDGRVAVAVFIVLSGYCLMLPVARAKDGRLRGGMGPYLKRRSLRILPPYYAAVALGVILPFLVPPSFLDRNAGWWWRTMWPVASPGVLLSHLTLVHNLDNTWFYKINAALWTVATEWQIYFIFPLVLLPVWRRWGGLPMLALAVVLGVAPLATGHFELASPWFIGLFASGMAAASLAFPRTAAGAAWRDRLPWGTLSAMGFAAFFLEAQFGLLRRMMPTLSDWKFHFLIDNVAGFAAAGLTIFCTRRLLRPADRHRTPAILRLLEARWVVGLGLISYSLYLTHAMVLVVLELAAGAAHASVAARAGVFLVLGMPLSVAFSYAFYRVFERPFVRRHMLDVKSAGEQTTTAGPLVALPGGPQ